MASIRGIARTAGRHATAPLRPAATTTTTFSHNSHNTFNRCASRQSSSQSQPPAPGPTDLVFEDLELDSSFLTPSPLENINFPSPLERAKNRTERLPGSRYQYHPPKFDRGPLHPIQTPPSSDPVARDFVPGPYNLNRLRQTYHTTIASDLMALTYTHTIPGTEKVPTPQRLRSWDDSSPYHKNRPLRQPRGDPKLSLLEKPITFRNIPEIRSVTLAAFVPLANKDPDQLIVARMVTQAITGVCPTITRIRKNVGQWGIIKGQKGGVKVTLYGNQAYDFLDKCINIVLPRIKDWPGVKGSTGDSSGNLAFGLTSENTALFPEVEANYDMYPAKQIPGYRIFVETTAKSDRHARLLLGSFGLPFYGRLRD